MKKVYKDIFLFLAFVIMVLTSLFIGVSYWHLNKPWTLQPEVHTVFIGDSHPEQAINDKEWKGIRTFAQSGDCYLYTFCKTKKLLEDNPNIDQVVVGVDYHNVDVTAEEWYSNQSYLDFKLPQVFALFGKKEYKELFKRNAWGLIKAMPKTFSINDLLGDNVSFINKIGSFQVSALTLSKDSIDFNRRSNYIQKPSTVQLYYLKQIISYCKSRGKRVYLLTAPIHKSVKRIDKLDKVIQGVANEFQLPYFNFRDMELDDAMFADLFHLNEDGSKIFTRTIMSLPEFNTR